MLLLTKFVRNCILCVDKTLSVWRELRLMCRFNKWNWMDLAYTDAHISNFYNSINLRRNRVKIVQFVQFTQFPPCYARLLAERVIDGHSVRFNQRPLDAHDILRQTYANNVRQILSDILYNNTSARDSSFPRAQWIF